jgi:hypothetical protein
LDGGSAIARPKATQDIVAISKRIHYFAFWTISTVIGTCNIKIKVDLKDIVCEYVEHIQLAKDKLYWCITANTAINLIECLST